ncbi:MAG TPA: hypothetical protein PKN45_00365 [Candidatus Limiplasma sp.]|nr:hypothetical protein [Candidatus Limiplasma sp.]HPR77419.1 hypothetical protein [Candidatus Limiplasma sp.]
MKNECIAGYEDFIRVLLDAGFSMGGGNNKGIFSIVPWSWDETPPYDTPVRWHTGDPETDPWEWRMRVLDERKDIAYAKMFFNASGYLTAQWAPSFLAVRRGRETLAEAYEAGRISHLAKRVYETVAGQGVLPLHAIKPLAGIAKEDASRFERALVELQMKMYLTMCGRQQKTSAAGKEYGWSSTVFCTVEDFWGEAVLAQAAEMDREEAIARITAQVLRLNPGAEPKKVKKFIEG